MLFQSSVTGFIVLVEASTPILIDSIIETGIERIVSRTPGGTILLTPILRIITHIHVAQLHAPDVVG